MKKLLFAVGVCLLVAQPCLAQSKVPLRYQNLVGSARLKVVDVLGSPEMTPSGEQTSAFTPDGKFAVYASGEAAIGGQLLSDAILSLWDVHKGTSVKEFPVGRVEVTALSVSPDAKLALVAHSTPTPKGDLTHRLVLWDLAAGKELRTVAQPKSVLLSVALSPDRQRALAGSVEGKLHLWDIDSGKELVQFKDVQNLSTPYVLFSPDGKQVFTAWGTKVRLWDLSTVKVVQTFGDHQGEVLNMALSADGKRLAVSDLGQNVHVWDVESGKSLASVKKDQNTVAISLGIAPDGGRVVLVSNGFDAATGTREECFVSTLDVAVKKEVWTEKANFRGLVPIHVPAKGEALIGGGPNPWTLWNLDKGYLHNTWGGHKTALAALAHDANHLYSVGQDGSSKIWVQGASPKSFLGLRDIATALTAGAETVLSATADKALMTWNDRTTTAQRIPTTHTGTITCIALAPGGKRAVSAGSDRVVKYWDLENAKELRSFTGHAENINAVAVSPDGEWAASASDDNSVRLWPLVKPTADVDPIIFEDHNRQVTCLAFSPSGKYLVTGSQDQTLKLWDVAKQKVVRTFTGHKNWVHSVLFRGEDQLVSAADDLTVRVWDVATAKELDKLDLASVADCPKCLTMQGDNLYVGTAGWVILKVQMK